MTETLLDGLIGAGIATVVAAIPAFIALNRSRQANEIAKEANDIAKKASEETRLASQRPRQYKLLDEARALLVELRPKFDQIASHMTRAIHIDNTAYDRFAEDCRHNTAMIVESAGRVRALASKLKDVHLVDLLDGLGLELDQLHPALRETSQHALTIAKLAKSNAAYGADRPAVVLLQESADRAAGLSAEARQSVDMTLEHLNVLEREGLK